MDPITLAVPVLVVIGGKVVEKWGEKIREKTFEAGEKLLKPIAPRPKSWGFCKSNLYQSLL